MHTSRIWQTDIVHRIKERIFRSNRLWVKGGPAGTVVLLTCRANKGESDADRPRGLFGWHFSFRKRFSDVPDATHQGAMWEGKRGDCIL